ncbi:MAG TPA: LON peptidase substrate-binding domain-containing protein [Myxococcales bacterium]|nr:LON peptidase substrate-binding domain-containing protein [Myxococcales bacterium]
MDDAERIRRALPTLPIFPLPGAVLLPHALVPLHIFEPRYRKMTKDCEAGLRVLALANIPDDQAAAERPARVAKVIGVGVLARVEPLPDGRFNIVLRGVRRALIEQELPTGEPYRLVRAVPLDPAPPAEDAARKAADLKALVLAFSSALRNEETRTLAQLAARATDPGDLADIVAGALLSTPRDRQAVLEAVEIEPRLELALQAAAAALARTAINASAPN